MKRSLPCDLFRIGLVIWWKSWDIRNKELHGVGEGFPSDIVAWSREYLNLYHSAQVAVPSVAPRPEAHVWAPPGPDFVKVNVDSSIRVSMVAHNENEVTVWWDEK